MRASTQGQTLACQNQGLPARGDACQSVDVLAERLDGGEGVEVERIVNDAARPFELHLCRTHPHTREAAPQRWRRRVRGTQTYPRPRVRAPPKSERVHFRVARLASRVEGRVAQRLLTGRPGGAAIANSDFGCTALGTLGTRRTLRTTPQALRPLGARVSRLRAPVRQDVLFELTVKVLGDARERVRRGVGVGRTRTVGQRSPDVGATRPSM
mmetsp:Transcript_31339/g.91402  ORF Transcript_31339/g.91402 Transcript_31339/m.91402 type:complete len:212 (-) Transcript_31339:2066-2701(-)